MPEDETEFADWVETQQSDCTLRLRLHLQLERAITRRTMQNRKRVERATPRQAMRARAATDNKAALLNAHLVAPSHEPHTIKLCKIM
jgi:hypothetical protein